MDIEKDKLELELESQANKKQIDIIDELEAQKYLNKFKTTLLVVPINSIRANSWNPNHHDELTHQTLLNSIKKFGFTDPVSVRQVIADVPEYDIIDGEHRWQGAKELGFTEISVINYGETTQDEAKTLTMLLNLRGRDDILEKARLQKELKIAAPSLFDLLPGSEKDKEETMKLLDFDFSQFDNTEGDNKESEKDLFKEAHQLALKLQIILEKVHQEATNENLKLAIEQFRSFVSMLKSYISS